ncbi:MAG: S1C family serine protease [Anaerolineales bacterium]|jgi:S1-C subfamily serine protease
MKRSVFVMVLMVSVLALAGLACQSFAIGAPTAPPAAVETVVVTQVPLAPAEVVIPDLVSLDGSLTGLYDQVNQGVVSIRVVTDQGEGQGSGFVIDKQGHVVTNYHVVEGANQVEVDFPSGFKAYGEVLGSDLDSDLAVVLVDAPEDELVPLKLGDSDNLKVGQTVVAIGNPFGLSGTMTIGIISGKGRTLDSLREAPSGQYFTAGDVLQTDAAINPGNSGGPLLNLEGEVIGVNRAIRTNNFNVTGEPTNSGIGFAVSVNIVKRVVPSLIANGKYDYPYLGISAYPEISLAMQQSQNLPSSSGVYVTEVTANGPSDQAGIEVGDLITKADGQDLRVFGDLIGYLFNTKQPGDSVELTFLRNGNERTATVVLSARP